MNHRLSVLTLLAFVAISSVSALQADLVTIPQFNVYALKSDGSNIDNTSKYIMAVNFWDRNNGSVYNVNGVNFTTVANTNTYTANGVTMTYGNITSGEIIYHSGNSSTGASGNLSTILSGMIYNNVQSSGGSIDMTFTGLTPGQTYTYTVYARRWGSTSDSRRHSFLFDSSDTTAYDTFVRTYDSTNTPVSGIFVSEDKPSLYWDGISDSSPYAMEYTFTAPESGTFTVKDTGTNASNSWHFYAASLKEATLSQTDVPAQTTIVNNGNFDTDVFFSDNDNHGYCNTNTPITGWTASPYTRVGLTLWTDKNQTTQRCTDFIKAEQTANLPDGSKNVAFIQGTETTSLSQNVTLEPDTEYVLSYYAGARTTRTCDPNYTVNVDDQTAYSGMYRVNQFDLNKITYHEYKFTSQSGDSAYETALKFTVNQYSDANSSTDRSLLLSNVQIVKASDYVAPTLKSGNELAVNGWVASRWNSDATAYLSGTASDYTSAINFGTSSSVTLSIDGTSTNTLTFTNGSLDGTSSTRQFVTGNTSWFCKGGSAPSGFTDSFYKDSGSKELARSTSYSFDKIKIDGLEPGATYETTLYLRSYGDATTDRVGTFTINGNTSSQINVDSMASINGGGLTIQYTGQADDHGVIFIKVNNQSTDTFHISGLSNRYVSASETEYNIPLRATFSTTNGKNSNIFDKTVSATGGTASGQLATKTWTRRGYNNTGILDNYEVKSGDNSASVLTYCYLGNKSTATAEAIEGTAYGASKITLSADLHLGDLTGTGTGSYNAARGVGIGFFDRSAGGAGAEVGIGFSGLVLMPDGTLLYYDRADAESSATTTAIAWGSDLSKGGSTWTAGFWTNVAMDLELLDDGLKAKILNVSVTGSSADYSSLIGKIFNTTDLIGFSTSASSSGKVGYVDNFQLIVREVGSTEVWNQKHEQYRAEYIASAKEILTSATSFRGENSTKVAGTSMDIIDLLGTNNVWQARGMGTGTWNADRTRNGNPAFTIIDNQAMTSANSGVSIAYDKSEIVTMDLSVDLKMSSLDGSDYNNTRGLGMGFFDSEYGLDLGGEVGLGFSGIVVSPNGGLYYYQNLEDGLSYTTPIAYQGGSFDKSDWYTLTMSLDFFTEDGELKAILTDVGLSGSTADYSSLIGKVFSTTDLLGLTSASNNWSHFGVFDNFSMSKTVPEPSTWALLILGTLGLMWYRRAGRVSFRKK